MTCHRNILVYDVRIVLHTIIPVSVFRIKRRTHIDTVQPHLVRIHLLMPESAILIARMSVELAAQQVESFPVLLLLRLLIDAEQELARIQTVYVILM